MKNPLELAEQHCMDTAGFVSKQDRGTFLAGYEAAHQQILALVRDELKRVQAMLPDTELMAIEYALETLIEKIEKV